MAKLNVQQIGILIITAVMVIGTLGSFAVMVLENDNQKNEQAKIQAASKKYQAAMDKRDEEVAAQNAKFLPTLKKYSSYVKKFKRDDITKLKTIDLQKGDGKEVKDDTKLAVFYIGWNPDGKIFDQSIEGDKLKAPFAVDGPKEAQVIEGWQKGLIGMRLGGVRLLEIPSDMAYGEQGSGDYIGPNTPLKFIVYVIEPQKEIPYPEVPKELLGAY